MTFQSVITSPTPRSDHIMTREFAVGDKVAANHVAWTGYVCAVRVDGYLMIAWDERGGEVRGPYLPKDVRPLDNKASRDLAVADAAYYDVITNA